MDNDFSEKLKNVLSDPTAMAKITAIADSLGMGGNTKNSEPIQEDKTESLSDKNLSNAFNQSLLPAINTDPRLALLETLKPLLKEEKRNRIDSITRALTMVNVMKTLRK